MFADRLTSWTDRLTVTIKPTWICNLRCRYCYQGRSLPARGKAVMSPEVLEASIRQVAALPLQTVDLQWIGGETLAPGLPFYEKALELTKRHQTVGGPKIVHWLQTNVTLIDESWVAFFQDHHDDVVLSISYDFFEDYFFATQNGARAARHQWAKIQRALDLLKASNVEFGCLTTIDETALRIPAQTWFECWLEQDIRRIGLQLDYGDVYSSENSRSRGQPWRKYADFLDELFALQADHNEANPERALFLRESLYLYNKLINVRSDDWIASCHHMAALCGHFFWTIDVDGEVYAMCDAFMTNEEVDRYRLGNVLTDAVGDLKGSEVFADLTERQHRLKHRRACRQCRVYGHCKGGCPAFKSFGNRLDDFDPDSVYCEYSRAYFDNILNDDKRRRLHRIYDTVCG